MTKDIKDWKVGDWVYIQYGFNVKLFYITRVLQDGLLVCSPKWLSKEGQFIPYSELFLVQNKWVATGEKRWWYKFLPKFLRELLCPYKLPKDTPLEIPYVLLHE